MDQKLFTVGYEGLTIDAFITNLLANNINCVLDVRALPVSRKKGFSKNQLAERLRLADIRYIHLGELGTPKELRDNVKSTGDYSAFFKTMAAYLATKEDAVEVAYEYVMDNTCCLMCYERLADQCHRKLIAEEIENRNGEDIQITHI